MPQIDKVAVPVESKFKIKAGDTIKNAEPAQAASPHTEGDTSAAATNAEPSTVLSETTETSVVPQETGKEGDDSLVSGSVKARKLGERTRKMASALLEDTTESGRTNFKKLVESDKELDKYFRKHFPAKYAQALNEKAPDSAPIDEASIKQQTRMEMLSEQIREEKQGEALDLAVRLKFTPAEAEDLAIMAEKLEGTRVGGKELDYSDALTRAARIIRPDKAKVGITNLPAGFGGESFDAETKVSQRHEKIAESYRGLTGLKRDKANIVKNLQTVESGYNEKQRRFVMPR